MAPGGKQAAGKIEIYGNQTTFNIPEPIVVAVKNSPYFKQLYELKTFHQVVDEIYNEVEYVEPWVAGKGLGTASSAFSLLYKLFLMKLSEKQVQILIDHQDSPYIRAIGFLYLRYGLNPRELWSWMKPYVEDAEEIVPRSQPNSKPITIGRFVRDLLRNIKFYDTMLPRIPVVAAREIEKELEAYKHEAKAGDEKQATASDRAQATRRPREESGQALKRRKRSASRSPSRERYGYRDHRDSRDQRDHRDNRDRRDRRDYRDNLERRNRRDYRDSPERRDRRDYRDHRDRRDHRSSRDHRDRSHNNGHRRDRSRSGSRSRSPRGRHSTDEKEARRGPHGNGSNTEQEEHNPFAGQQQERMQAVRAKYGSSTATDSLGTYAAAGTRGIVDRDVVLESQVPKAVLQYQKRQGR